MNIEDRAGLYDEAYRVLKPGGRLAIYDVIATDDRPLLYAVPRSLGPEASFLLTAAQMRTVLECQRFVVQD